MKALLGDIADIDIKILNRSVNNGVTYAKSNTPTKTGFMKKSWRATPAVKSANGKTTKVIVNSMDYSSYVNYGHRIVNKSGETVGWVNGQYILEKAVGKINKSIVKEFKKEIEKVNKEHDK